MGAAVWKIIGKLITPQEGEVSPLTLQLVVGRLSWSWMNL